MTFDEWWETTEIRTGNESERELAEFAWNAALSARPEARERSPVAWMWETRTNRGLTWTRCAPPEAEQATITPIYRLEPQKNEA